MARINLLPWREELRKERQRQFATMSVLVAIVAGFCVWLVILSISGSISAQRDRNNLLQTEIRKLDSQIREIQELEKQRAELINRMQIIQQLQQSRPQIVHLFDELVRVVPEGVTLVTLNRSGDRLEMTGITESSPRVSNFMRSMDASEWIKNPDVGTISDDKKSGTPRKSFTMSAQQTSPQAEEEEQL